jgi:hypothetical protein
MAICEIKRKKKRSLEKSVPFPSVFLGWCLCMQTFFFWLMPPSACKAFVEVKIIGAIHICGGDGNSGMECGAQCASFGFINSTPYMAHIPLLAYEKRKDNKYKRAVRRAHKGELPLERLLALGTFQ